MIELILVRHAKSDWGDAGLRDHDRTLNDRGLRDASEMAERLAGAGFGVERILSSTAVRARTTSTAFGAALDVKVELDPELYLAPAETLFETAGESGLASVMLVAHNPGISDLTAQLSDGGIKHMPMCGAVARFAWDAESWEEIAGRAADRWELNTPR